MFKNKYKLPPLLLKIIYIFKVSLIFIIIYLLNYLYFQYHFEAIKFIIHIQSLFFKLFSIPIKIYCLILLFQISSSVFFYNHL